MMTTPEIWMMDWNKVNPPPAPVRQIQVHDETLRDGLQSPSVKQPTLDGKIEFLHLMNLIGVDSACLGMPASSPVIRHHVEVLAAEMAAARIPMAATCAARTVRSDIAAVARISQATGLPMWVTAFVGISPIRMFVERWSAASVVRGVRDAVRFARREGLRVCLVTEDTTRSLPGVARDVYAAALGEGAEKICVCDTVGYATPWGAAAVVAQLRAELADLGYPGAGIDWHGHNDRGLALANSLSAASAGADRLHGTALGIGERAGNASTEQLLVNLGEAGWRAGALDALPRYCELAARMCGVAISGNQPLIGKDVYRTAAGVHAAAIRKAECMGSKWLAERVYAGVPASVVGREQSIDVGPGSGTANILSWLEHHRITPYPALVEEIQRMVAGATRVLTDAELLAAADEVALRALDADLAQAAA